MAKAKKVTTAPADDVVGPRPRLAKLIIKNFRAIGNDPVVVELDDIVVLVGPNNVGKSSVLKAFQIVMAEGSKDGELTLDDFPGNVINPERLPEIELHTVVFDQGPGGEWVEPKENGEGLVRERWRWVKPGAPERVGFNANLGRWAEAGDDETKPWGMAGVANARRPQPHFVDAFASPDEQAAKIIKLLMTAIEERVKAHRSAHKENPESDFAKLLAGLGALQRQIVAESEQQITQIQDELSQLIGRVFPGHRVVLDAKPEDDLDKAINWFKANPQLLMGPEGGHLSSVGNQGSGARRTLLWTAIRLIAESTKKTQAGRPYVLLLDEPEICLHPGAVREACALLYSLPALTGNWQVMLTTHSPAFVDFSRDHTSIVRVSRAEDGHVSGTTIFRPSKAEFDEEDRECLKLLNICDPHVAEFFFGGRSVIVEGDTEYTAFRTAIAMHPERFKDVHVIRARGKATVVSLCKILNQFGSPYAVLHDSDRPTYEKKDGSGSAKNPAWAHNESIRKQVALSSKAVRLLASLPNFEEAYCGIALAGDKPYTVAKLLASNEQLRESISQLLECLVNFEAAPPAGCLQWMSIEELEQAVAA